MKCAECGAPFTPKRYDQCFCCTQHKNNYHQRLFDKRAYDKRRDYLIASNDIDQLKQDNEALREQVDKLNKDIENWKEVVRRHHNERDDHLRKIEERDDTITSQKKEIDRLKLERRVYEQERTKRHQSFSRDHLERVLTSEIKRQFPKDPTVQEHIGPIRHFAASYINALVTA